MDLSDDIFQWVWRCDNTFFICDIVDNDTGYYITDSSGNFKDEFTKWMGIHTIKNNSYYKKHKPHYRTPLYGPFRPPVSPVIKKIREMAKRQVHV